MRFFLCVVFVTLAMTVQAESRADLLFRIQTGLKMHNAAAVRTCFNFTDVDEATKATILAAIDRMSKWSAHKVYASERKDLSPFQMQQGGVSYILNGNWQYQVHIIDEANPTRGYVFPAGETNGKMRLLIAVPQSR